MAASFEPHAIPRMVSVSDKADRARWEGANAKMWGQARDSGQQGRSQAKSPKTNSFLSPSCQAHATSATMQCIVVCKVFMLVPCPASPSRFSLERSSAERSGGQRAQDLQRCPTLLPRVCSLLWPPRCVRARAPLLPSPTQSSWSDALRCSALLCCCAFVSSSCPVADEQLRQPDLCVLLLLLRWSFCPSECCRRASRALGSQASSACALQG